MPHPKPEALRRMVSDLAALHADDISAILADLKPRERQTVEGLLREHASYFDAAVPGSATTSEEFDAARLSPWLLQRMRGEDRFTLALTVDARQALLDAAIRATPRPAVLSSAKGRP
jgi:hypothetical protein